MKTKDARLPKVSVIIPVYNDAEGLEKCLNSVLDQKYPDYEVIVIDNNSQDKTPEVISRFQKKDKRIVSIFEPDCSRGAARNTGERHAKADIILMTDSDCTVPKDWINDMTKLLLDGRYDAVQGFQVTAKSDYWSRNYQAEAEKKIRSRGNQIVGYVDTKNFAIKRSFLKKVGFTSRNYPIMIDNELSIRLKKENVKIIFNDQIRVRHHHPDTLIKIIKKQFNRARWAVVLGRENRKFLESTDFIKRTAQDPRTFFYFFYSMAIETIKHGIKANFYNFITGLSWRVGIVYGIIFMRRNPDMSALRLMTHSDFRSLQKKDPNYYNAERWKYFKEVIGILKKEKYDSVLELGHYKMPIVLGCDTMDIRRSPIYKHDATVIPWPIEDKKYDIFIALQVWEHLNDKQEQAFREVMRISKMAIISFPLNWKMKGYHNMNLTQEKNDQYIRSHSEITENKIRQWTLNTKPVKTIKVRCTYGYRIINFYKFGAKNVDDARKLRTKSIRH